jgi:hypothetical protein
LQKIPAFFVSAAVANAKICGELNVGIGNKRVPSENSVIASFRRVELGSADFHC